MLDKKYGTPFITNDGVTIAKEIELEDPFENMGAQLVKEVATKTNDVAGDGTTTATVLAQAMIHEGLKNVAAGANSDHAEKTALQKADGSSRVESIQEPSAQPVSRTSNSIAQVASISAGDEEVGDAGQPRRWRRWANDGVITVEESKTMNTELDLVEGMQFDRGYAVRVHGYRIRIRWKRYWIIALYPDHG